MSDINETLAQRGSRYGPSYVELAKMSQNLKRTMRCAPNWVALPADIRESLELIQLKVARIICGDPEYKDNWHDIIGYAKLIDDRLAETGNAA
jgi:hypothetical protein